MTNRIGHKTIFVFLLVLVLIVVLAMVKLPYLQSKSTGSTGAESNESSHIIDASKRFDFTDWDQYVGYADHILVGNVIGSSTFSPGTTEYVVSVERQVKGNTQAKKINVYAADQTLDMGETYVLFMERTEGGLYPATVYKILTIDDSTRGYVKVDNKHLVHKNKFIKSDSDLDGLITSIQTSPSIGKNRNKDPSEGTMMVMDSASTEQLTRSSDVIAEIKVDSVSLTNKYMTFATVQVVNAYKGELHDGGGTVILPSSVEAGEDYLVYLQLKNGSYIVTAKTGSVIPKSDAKAWDEALKKLT